MKLDEAANIMGGRVASSAERPGLSGYDGLLQIVELSYDSRDVAPGCLFFCIRGDHSDGHDFAVEAVEKGAAAVVSEHEVPVSVPQIVVGDSFSAMNRLAAPFFGNPSTKMQVIGVSGTNGKTTTTYMLDSIFRAAGRTTGLIGTVETKTGAEAPAPGNRTTPESTDLQRLLARMVRAHVTVCAMEVTSIGLTRGRVQGTRFGSAIFTNLTQDHLDYHESMESYYQAKKTLFSRDFAPRAAINSDDAYGARLLAETDVETLRFGIESDSDLRAKDIRLGANGSEFRVFGAGVDCLIRIRLPGRFNVSNALAAMAGALLEGLDPEPIVAGLAHLASVPGRMEPVEGGQDFLVIVDYAHTPAAMEALTGAARELAPSGRLILVFGCGGDRDRAKRPLMGKAAGASDIAIITSDNPRDEDPFEILSAVEQGVKTSPPPGGYFVTEDREAAIRQAVDLARPGDVVVIAGKGHETGQTVRGFKHPFDDRKVALDALRASRIR